MTTFKCFFVATLAAASLWGQPKIKLAKPPVTTSIENVELVAAGTDHARFEVHAKVTALRSATVTRIRFEEMRLGDIPFYLSAIDQRLELRSGQVLTLPAISMTVYFRDLDSLGPLLDIVRNGEIRVHGRASANIDLNLIEKLALHEWSGHAEIPIDNAIPVSLPGGAAGRAAAAFALNTAQTALGMTGSALNSLRTVQEKWNGELRTDFAGSLVVVDSSYRLLTTDGQTIEVDNRGLGFQVAGDRILITGEAAEPWKYDPDTVALLEARKAAIMEESRSLLVWPVDGNAENGASLTNGRLQFERVTSVQDGDTNAGVRAAKRDTDSNYAVLRLTRDEDRRKEIPEVQSSPGQSWDRVAVFKLNSDGTAETVFVAAQRRGNRLIFETAVDDETFGSPVIVPGGVIGMVQDEYTGVILPATERSAISQGPHSEPVPAAAPERPSASTAPALPPIAPPAAAPEPKSIEVGMTTDQVVAILGPPQRVVKADTKVIYDYQDLKAVFVNGKLTDVQ